MLLLPPLLPPFLGPLQLALGVALGWLLRGHADLSGTAPRDEAKR